MILLGLLLLTSPQTGPMAEYAFFFDLEVELVENRAVVRPKIQPLELEARTGKKLTESERVLRKANLDGPLREAIPLLRSVDEHRKTLFPNGVTEAYPLLTYTFNLASRDITGLTLDRIKYEVQVCLDPEAGVAVLKGKNVDYRFALADLTKLNYYATYLSRFLDPIPMKPLRGPKKGEFLIDLYYDFPTLSEPFRELRTKEIYRSRIYQKEGFPLNMLVQLGTTYCSVTEEGELNQISSRHLHFQDKVNKDASRIRQMKGGKKNNNRDKLIAALEDYLTKVPNDEAAMSRLVEAYWHNERHDRAFGLIDEYRPLLMGKKGETSVVTKIENEVRRKREALYADRLEFEERKGAMTILSPKEDDVVGGTGKMVFHLEGVDAKMFQADLIFDGRKIGTIHEPPFEIPYELGRSFHTRRMEVVAYFEDRTWATAGVDVKVIPVDNQSWVNLTRMRVVATQRGKRFLSQLTRDDVRLNVDRESVKIEEFRFDEKPLRVAILLDTSTSMNGDKLYQAQYAVKTFLEQLEERDRACVFAFDRKVFRLSDFTNEYDKMIPQLLTLSPMSLTSLYDGIFVAHQELMRQEGTKVMVIISDGADKNSTIQAPQLKQLFDGSPVLVYSILLDDMDLKQGEDQGKSFLKNLSSGTGSISMELKDAKDLSRSFKKIYTELKSSYFLEFYHTKATLDESDVELDIFRRGGRARCHFISSELVDPLAVAINKTGNN